jgi:uncharacterized protein YodC (DUF2158 family)
MRTDLSNASYVSKMFMAYVRNNKVPPTQVEELLRGIKQGLEPEGRELARKRHIKWDRSVGQLKGRGEATEEFRNGFTADDPNITEIELSIHATEERLLTQEPQPGDEVVLKTGGPVMTVLGVDDDRARELFCVWFDEQRRRRHGTFHANMLKFVE